MSVTITRRQAIELGEKAIKMFEGLGLKDEFSVEAFRQTLRTTQVTVRGNSKVDGITCPMEQAGRYFGPGIRLAYCWDDVTREAGLNHGGFGTVIYINPYTSA